MQSLGEYFRNDNEELMLKEIRSICKVVAPDEIIADIDRYYWENSGDNSA